MTDGASPALTEFHAPEGAQPSEPIMKISKSVLTTFNRRNIVASIIGAGALALAGCGGGAPTETETAPSPEVAESKPTVPSNVILPLEDLEKTELKFGFIKLTDMAPLAIAKEKGYFAEEGLNVTLEPQANWKVLLDGVIDGQLDGAHMLAGQPLAATIGFGTEAHIITPFSMD